MINVIIADDIRILRIGLAAVLEKDNEICVKGLASNGREAYELCKSEKPDIVLMDMRMPDFDGAYGTKRIKAELPEIKVLVLTTFDDDETIKKAVESGADGYILKEMDNDSVISAIKAMVSGVSVFGTQIFEKVKSGIKPNDVSEFGISEREKELMILIAEGYDNKEIAAKMFLAEGTVRNSISKLLEKLNLRDRTQLAVFAVKHNLA